MSIQVEGETVTGATQQGLLLKLIGNIKQSNGSQIQ